MMLLRLFFAYITYKSYRKNEGDYRINVVIFNERGFGSNNQRMKQGRWTK